MVGLDGCHGKSPEVEVWLSRLAAKLAENWRRESQRYRDRSGMGVNAP